MSESSEWLGESIVNGWKSEMQVGKWLFDGKSEYHDQIAVFESVEGGMGRVLVLEGRIQLTSRDEFTYHEMFAHVPLMLLPEAKRVLIIGGGDGATLREVLKHERIHATLVDIDGEVVKCSKEYLPSLHQGAWDHERATVIIGDGIKFVKETDERFDVVIVDSTDPEEEGPSSVLYQSDFYAACKRVLRDPKRGVVLTQNGHPQFEPYPKKALANLASCFEFTTVYQFSVPTYMGGLQAFGFASDAKDLVSSMSVEEAEKNFAAEKIETRHFTPAYGLASFVLPKWLAEQVEEANR